MPRTSDLVRGFLQDLRRNIDAANDEVLVWVYPHSARESAEIAYALLAASLVVHFSRLDNEMTIQEFSRRLQYWYEEAVVPDRNGLWGLMRSCMRWDANATHQS